MKIYATGSIYNNKSEQDWWMLPMQRNTKNTLKINPGFILLFKDLALSSIMA